MIDEDAVSSSANAIRKELSALGHKLQSGDDDQLLVWILPGELACAHRPLRHHPEFGGSGLNLPPAASPEVIRWVERIAESGIKSIICLMHPNEIRHYQDLDLGHASNIVDLYRRRGLEVHHLPWDDPAHQLARRRGLFKTELLRIRDEALQSFNSLQKPILLHCSAGIDRSAPVAAYICQIAKAG